MNRQKDRRGVLCAGRVYADLIFTEMPELPRLGTETMAGGLGFHAGGGAFITAAYLSSLGRPAELMSNIPSGPFGPILDAEIARFRVGTRFCASATAETEPQITVAMSLGDDRAFLTHRAGQAIPAHRLPDLARAGIGHLHIGELTTLLEHPELVAEARAAGLSISLDCGWDDALLSPEVADAVASVDVFLPNAVELEALLANGASMPMAPVTVVKRSARGADAWTGEGCVTANVEPVEVVDATGAGDAFNGGFLHAWLNGASLEACLQAGNACGSIAVKRRGGVGGLSQGIAGDVFGHVAG